jgi:hypothetical protein
MLRAQDLSGHKHAYNRGFYTSGVELCASLGVHRSQRNLTITVPIY